MCIRDSYTMMRESRVKSSDLSGRDHVARNPMAEYNHVINCYNSMENRIAEMYLKKLPERNYYNQLINTIRTLAKRTTLYLVILFIPIVGLFMLVWHIVCYLFYSECFRIYLDNKRLINDDPFVNMIFAPELCRITNSINHYYQVEIKDVEGFSFNKDIKNKLIQKAIDGKVRFMVYNSRFYDFYANFPRYKRFHVGELIRTSFLTFLNGLLVLWMEDIIWAIKELFQGGSSSSSIVQSKRLSAYQEFLFACDNLFEFMLLMQFIALNQSIAFLIVCSLIDRDQGRYFKLSIPLQRLY
eukprot:TRINITY_DN1961_c0_g1_i4.p1 TRINITY_DN1961_c0_g1~~TRINITY_DN1961_c0_g1_i4.p1  ORF type:complete len:298 (+),score=25.40 TRINITY_DN1961_c0_g1_i4:65-958(+)